MFLLVQGQTIIIPGCNLLFHLNSLLTKAVKMLLQVHFCLNQHIACLTALVGTNNASSLQLIHKAARPVVPKFHPPLEQ